MEVDKSNLREVIFNSLRQLNADLEFFNQLNISRRPFDKIILCGMGGSALMGDLFSFFKDNHYVPLMIRLPIVIHRSYELPDDISHNSLVICVSYSGNTEETISAYEAATKNNLEVAGIASGGKLAELLQKNRNPWIRLTSDCLQPRLSLGYQLVAMIKIFMGYGFLSPFALNEVSELAQKIKTGQIENEAKLYCNRLNHKIPIIYSSDKNQAIARIWKIKFNENTKIPAFFNRS